MDNKYTVSCGRPYNGTSFYDAMTAAKVTASDLLVILTLYEQYGTPDMALLIVKDREPK